MKRILLTGSTGFLGKALMPLLAKKGYEIYALVRDVARCPDGAVPLLGDVTLPDLGLGDTPSFTELFNLAGIVNLKGNSDTFPVNATGAMNVAHFARDHGVKRLVHVSTAYCLRRNPYEWSKEFGEEYVREVGMPTTIFKPSVIVANSTDLSYADGAFYLFFKGIRDLLGRADAVRQWLEGARLPMLEPVFRVPGNPHGRFNIIPVDSVARSMADIEALGVYYLTNPHPPTLGELVDWGGEVMRVKIRFEPEFDPTDIEALFLRKAKPFLPYLQGDTFPSSLQEEPRVDKAFVQRSVALYLSRC